MKDIYSEGLPDGWVLIILGDGLRALTTAIRFKTKYPERVYLIGRLPRCSGLFFGCSLRISLPRECRKDFALRMALSELAPSLHDEIPVIAPLSDEYVQILKQNENTLERSFLTDCGTIFSAKEPFDEIKNTSACARR